MSREVKERFIRIADKYDFMNHFLSMDADREWRHDAAKEAMLPKRSFVVLDSATGTGDLAFAVRDLALLKGKRVRLIGTDFVAQMLEIAKKKAREAGIEDIDFRLSDSLRTGFKSGSVDVVTTGFSLRNFDDVDKFLVESYRILKKGGRLVILEMAMPDDRVERMKFNVYSYFIRLASLFSDRAYSWLVESIKEFDKHALVVNTRRAGFKGVRMRSLRSGVAYLLTAEK